MAKANPVDEHVQKGGHDSSGNRTQISKFLVGDDTAARNAFCAHAIFVSAFNRVEVLFLLVHGPTLFGIKIANVVLCEL